MLTVTVLFPWLHATNDEPKIYYRSCLSMADMIRIWDPFQ